MEKIIIVGDYNRDDFLYVGKLLHEKCEIYFLEYLDRKEIKSENYKKWGKALFWKDYNNAVDLIDKLKPTKVLFYFIESFNHVALNVACKYKGIKTFHIEHGIRNYEIQEKHIHKENVQVKHSFLKRLNKVYNVISRIKSRYFFINTVSQLPEHLANFLKVYFKVRSANNIFNTFRLVDNQLRLADCYISFSPKIFEFHQKNDHLPQGYPVYFIGCPAFDYLKDYAQLQEHGNDILFIDNAFETQKLFGWDVEKKIHFLEELTAFASKQNRKLWIKIHPYSKKGVYDKCRENCNVNIISNELDFNNAIINSHVIIGFYSTLLMPLMAFDHTVCFSLEMHPYSSENKLSSFLVDTGAIKSIDNWEDLQRDFEQLPEVFKEQKSHKRLFVENWMYKFDGKSSVRLKNILLGEAS